MDPSEKNVADSKKSKQTDHIRTDHLMENLEARTVRGGAVTIVSQVAQFIITIASTVILARLLTPQDYGLLAMVTAVLYFITPLLDMNLSTATIQQEELNQGQVSTLFWINLGLSVVVILILTLLAPLLALFYKEPRVFYITIVYSTSILFQGASTQHLALLTRQMRFVSIAAIKVCSILVANIVAILMAYYGMKYWALVGLQIALALTMCIGAWVASGWRPGKPQRDAGLGALLKFGGNITGYVIFNVLARKADNLLVGWYWGARELGIYSKAYRLLWLPVQYISAFNGWAISSLSRLRSNPPRYRQVYLKLLEKIALLSMPGIAFMIVSADWLIEIVLGGQWLDAVPVFAILGIAGLLEPVAHTVTWLFVSQGRDRDILVWGFISGLISIVSFVIGLPWGAVGVATSFSIGAFFIRVPLMFYLIGRKGPVSMKDIYQVLVPIFLATLVGGGTAFIFRLRFAITDPWSGSAISLATTVGATLLVLLLLPSGRSALGDAKKLLQFMYAKKNAQGD